MRDKVDFLIVGAGFSGMTAAHRLCQAGYKVAVVDKRTAVGGNAVEATDENGTIYHPYGPHIFHTNSQRIHDYVRQFTDLTPVGVRVTSFTGGRHWSFPVNHLTYDELVGRETDVSEYLTWLKTEGSGFAADGEDSAKAQIIKRAGQTFYDLFYKDYIWKLWGRDASQLDPAVGVRIPVHTCRDETYLTHRHVGLPTDGYGALFKRMLEEMPDADIRLGVAWDDARYQFEYRHLIFTGPLDLYFRSILGRLPYRTIKFTVESHKGGLQQPSAVVATPDLENPFTRSTELGHLTGQRGATVIVREEPCRWKPGMEPHYPLQTRAAAELADQYRRLAAGSPRVTFLGRLGSYRYYNMDQAIGQALTAVETLKLTVPRRSA